MGRGKNQIRVLHPITRLIVGGAQENTILTASLLDCQRFEVNILSGTQTGSEGSLIGEVVESHIPLILVPELVRQINPWLDTRALKRITATIQSRAYDIVHTHSSKAGILGRLAAKRAKTPIIVHTIHGWSFHDHMSPWLNWIYISLERLTASFTDALIAVSERDIRKGLALKIGSLSKYHLIRSAIPFTDFKSESFDASVVRQELNIPEAAVVIGTVGRFSHQKNPLDWIRIASMVGQAFPGAHFLMVGDGPLREQAEILAEQKGLTGRILFAGIRRDIPRMLSAMDIFMSTSLWEGLPRTIVQAMRMNLPVLAFRIDGLEQIIQHEDTGLLTASRDLAQMAIYCQYLLENSNRRQVMGRNGRLAIKDEFNVSTMIKRIEELYLELLAKKI